MNLNKINKNYYIYAILIFVFIPLNFIPQLWDAVSHTYGFEIGDILGVETQYKEVSRHVHLFIIYIISFLTKHTSLPAEIFFDNLTIIFLILFCLEVKKISKILFDLENRWSNLAALFTAIFPIWHILVAFNISQHLYSFYFLLFGYRNFISNNKIRIFIGMFFIFMSFNTESSLSFIIGLVFVSLIVVKLNNNKRHISLSTFKILVIIFSCLIYYFIIRGIFFPPYGIAENYNTVNFSDFSNLLKINLLKNILNYSTFLILFLWIPLFFLAHIFVININNFTSIKIFIKKNISFNFINNYSLLIMLSAFAIFPYLLLNKSSSLLYLSDYYQRHALLLAPISGIFFSTLFRDLSAINHTIRNKVNLNFYLIIFICINLILLNYGNYRKIESFLFRINLTQELKTYGSIPKGDVLFVGSNIPADLRVYELNHILYKAYNEAGWWSTTFGSNKHIKPPSHVINNERYKKEYVATDYEYRCSVYIYLKNDLGKFNRIKKFYIFNYKKYYNIDKIEKKC